MKEKARRKISVLFLVFLIVSLVFSFVQFVPTVKANLAWLSGWSYRKQITISGSSGAGTNYQVLLKVGETSGASGEDFDVEGHCQDTDWSNGVDDITFTDDDETTELYHWLEATSGSGTNERADFWVKVADNLGSNMNIYIYYGKSSGVPTSYRDATNTFLISDDFTGNNNDDPNTAIWDLLETNSAECIADIQSNKLKHHKYTGTAWHFAGIVSDVGFDLGVSSGVRVLCKNQFGVATAAVFYFIIGVTPDRNNANFDNVQNHMNLIFWDHTDYWILQWRNSGIYYQGVDTLVYDTNEHKLELLLTKSNLKWYVDAVLKIDDDLSPNYATTTNYLRTCLWKNTGGYTCWSAFDWIRVAKYVSPEPTFSSAGTEETVGEEYDLALALAAFAAIMAIAALALVVSRRQQRN